MSDSRLGSVLSWLCGALLTLALSGCGSMGAAAGPGSPATEKHPLVGAAAPNFELATADGKRKVSLASYAGKVVVVDFWATWCGPCHESFPAYQRLASKLGDKLTVIGISVDDDPAGIPKFARETGAKFLLLWDDGQTVSKSYEPPTMPTSFVIDASGIVRFVHAGFRSSDESMIETEVTSLAK